MCHVLGAEGRSVDHPIDERVMSVDLDHLAKAGHLVLACGGRARTPSILAAPRRVGCHTLVTDRGAAAALLLGKSEALGEGPGRVLFLDDRRAAGTPHVRARCGAYRGPFGPVRHAGGLQPAR